MPQPTKGPRLGGSPAHQRLMLANLATSLFEHGRITTTEAKARRLRPYAERLITKAKRGDLHNRREILKVIRDKDGRAPARRGDRPVLRRPQRWLHADHQDAAAQGRQRPDGRDRAGPQKTVTDEADRARRVAASQRRRPLLRRPRRRPLPRSETAARRQTAEAVEESTSTEDAPYGEGSHAPLEDPAEAPEGFPIKGNEDSKLYHVPGSAHYDRTVAEVWFATPEAAEAAGFQLPAAQREDADSEES